MSKRKNYTRKEAWVDEAIQRNGGVMPQIKKVKVNDFRVVVPKLEEVKRPAFIPNVIDKPRPSVALIGRRGGGKTTILYNTLKRWLWHRINEQQASKSKSEQNKQIDFERREDPVFKVKAIIFSSTLNSDPLYRDLLKPIKVRVPVDDEMQQKLCNYDPRTRSWQLPQPTVWFLATHPHFFDERNIKTKEIEIPNPWIDAYDSFDQLTEIFNDVKDNHEEIAYSVWVDDLSRVVRHDPRVAESVKVFRHYAAMFLSSQYLHDLPRDVRQNIDYLLLMRKIDREKIKKIWMEVGTELPEDLFVQLYRDATFADSTNDADTRGKFLFVDVDANKFRQGYDNEYDIPQVLRSLH